MVGKHGSVLSRLERDGGVLNILEGSVLRILERECSVGSILEMEYSFLSILDWD